MWSGLLAGVGALTTIVANRLATYIWIKVFDEDPPDRLMATPTRARPEPAPSATADAVTTARGAPPSVESGGAARERPELLVGAAFAGGLVLALILRRVVEMSADGRRTARTRPSANRLGGLREGVAARPRGDRARQGRGHREGHEARQGRRRGRRGRRASCLRADHLLRTRWPGSSTTCSTGDASGRASCDRRASCRARRRVAGFLALPLASRRARRPRPTSRSRRPSARASSSSSRTVERDQVERRSRRARS